MQRHAARSSTSIVAAAPRQATRPPDCTIERIAHIYGPQKTLTAPVFRATINRQKRSPKMEASQVNIEVGRVIYTNLYNRGRGVIYEVIGEPAPQSVRSLGGGIVMMGGRCEVNIAFEDGGRSLRLPECILMGVQWKLLDEVKSPEEVAEILAGALAYEAGQKAKEDEKKARFRAAADKARADGVAAGFIPENEFQAAGKRGSAAAYNLRLELKKAGIKARVKQDGYSAIDVYVDDENVEAAKEIGLKYKAGNFNGMEDIYDFDPCPWGSVFGDVKYVFVRGGL